LRQNLPEVIKKVRISDLAWYGYWVLGRDHPLLIILFVAALEWGYCGYNRSPGEAVWRRIALHDYFISHG
ncbi:hypothetical protein, partial [Yersinia pestis]|uniref:hypothetical protein n=1 Tax=Yersinia pestis TaxID=632 RepID=UPI001D1101E9